LALARPGALLYQLIFMALRFDPHLVNDPFGDPGVFVDLVFEKRALLFDLGDISVLPPRKLLRVSDVFITHRHMDHFAGFDHLLRIVLGGDKTLRLYGTPGLIGAVGHKLGAYTWNLIANYEGDLVFEVAELDEEGGFTAARFSRRAGFACEERPAERREGGLILKEPGLQVTAATLDHGVPVFAFALQERAQINIWRNRLEEMGLTAGPWLRTFKDAILRGEPDETPVEAACAPGGKDRTRSLPLGVLKQKVMRVTAGRKIAYVVDASFTESNVEKIVALAQNADILFIEATFLDADKERAAKRRHLTARQAGELAGLAGAKRMVTLHYSPKYKERGVSLDAEAQAAFARGTGVQGEPV
jgi:ribonuclease Z